MTPSNVIKYIQEMAVQIYSKLNYMLFDPTCVFFTLDEEYKTDIRERNASMQDNNSSA